MEKFFFFADIGEGVDTRGVSCSYFVFCPLCFLVFFLFAPSWCDRLVSSALFFDLVFLLVLVAAFHVVALLSFCSPPFFFVLFVGFVPLWVFLCVEPRCVSFLCCWLSGALPKRLLPDALEDVLEFILENSPAACRLEDGEGDGAEEATKDSLHPKEDEWVADGAGRKGGNRKQPDVVGQGGCFLRPLLNVHINPLFQAE